ncbi:MAG: sugar ABC transporter ATP-binding protein [Roseovarius sp.]
MSVKDVHKSFGPTRALDGVSFSAIEGEIHAIVGGNGCGKSTLAKVISGILPIDSGAASVLGESPSSPAESRAIGVSTVYQEVLVADESTVVDNVFMGSDALFSKTVSYEEKVARTARLMRDLSGEELDPHGLAGNLPLGLKQWITIARGMLSEPRVLILDESSAALDFDSTERLFEKMRDLRDGGVTILIVTHRIAELVRIADRATVLRDGRDVAVLEKAEITEKNLLAAMTGEEAQASTEHLVAPMPRGDEIAIHADGLTLWPGGRSFDFELRKGEIVGVAGLDGQGQDTFVRVLAGVQPAEAGLAFITTVNDETVPVRDLSDAVAGRVVYVSGDRKREGIFASLSIFENMIMPLYAQKRTGGVLGLIDWDALSTIFEREARNLMIRFGMKEDKITSLSGGNQQKVLIGRGIAQRPNTIVLNDPARGIDVGAKTELYRHLRSFAESQRSVVYMSSEIEEFIGFATRVIVFRDGAPFDAFDGRRFDTKQVLEAMFGQTDGSGLQTEYGLTPTRAIHAGGAARPADARIGSVVYPPADDSLPPIRIVETEPDPVQTFDRRKVRIVEFGRGGQVVRQKSP